MSVVSREIRVPLQVAYVALADPYTYPHWLVGCRDIRRVDDDWPAVGSKFHHRVGLGGPITVADNTKVLHQVDDEVLSLEVRVRPFGRGRATFTVTEGSDPGSTVVELDEVPLGLLAPSRPLADPLISRRNERSLANLADYLEAGRSHASGLG